MNIGEYSFERVFPAPLREECWEARYGEVSEGQGRYALDIDLLCVDAVWRYAIREDGTVIFSSSSDDSAFPKQAVDAAVTWIQENYTDKERVGVCECCGKVKDDIIEGLCSDCETERYTYWTVCKSNIDLESAHNHRHVFETMDGEWYGTGGSDMSERAYEKICRSFNALLDQMGRRFTRDLARTIMHGHIGYHAFHTVTGLITGPTLIFCYLDGGWMRKEKRFATHSYGEKLNALLSHYEDSADDSGISFLYGLYWLFGLDKDAQQENARTLAWITQWRSGNTVSSGREERA